MSYNPVQSDTATFRLLDDEHLLRIVQDGNKEALEYLIFKYKNFVRAKAKAYFLVGGEHEDIIQEGMIGLYKAIRDYRGDKPASFKAFAELCITRQMITAVKTATRMKHIPLNSYISLDKPIYDEESERTLMDVVGEDDSSDPEMLFINREECDDIEEKLSHMLSELERKVLRQYLDGRTYQEISVNLKRHIKSVDNALQRVKRKLEHCLQMKKLSI
ncbi:RNA polymerase sporulation sigma factor SigH [Sporolactobacillus sp. Y61]|jgi:RNA polymerase sporulation-specific sigma factor|uniref:RNA polymerase sporulation sigma factor SigH n=1 Tax=Sporolactobacillus sp. Y61 TaxID=3160863 RepID=A0AAU8IHW6_9BACL|nr:RNA polymerase sporulation sigma factor SigH [Sporolactobacillus sp. THM19-2]RYL89362.1 RNA polymerase sporulation sigma factor SigH [Sporolactobacillus sp. THM19-2]